MLEVWGWACAIVGAFLSVPQVIRLLRERTSAGLSVRTWQLNVAISLGWTLHGLRSGYANMLASNAIMAALAIAVLVMIQRDRSLSARTAWAFPILAFGVLTGMELLTTPLLFGLVILIPQLYAQVSQTIELVRAPDLSGLSTTFFAVGAVLPTMWFLWGVGAGDVSVLVTAAATALVCWFNLAWLLARTQGLVQHPGTAQPAAPAPEPACQS